VLELSLNWPDSAEGSSFYNELSIKHLTHLFVAANPSGGAARRPQTRGPPFPHHQPR
jgi:hypothetical protein